jgi:hypothetical protein
MIFVKLMKPFKCYLKIYPRRIFEEAGDDGGGVDFAAPPISFKEPICMIQLIQH